MSEASAGAAKAHGDTNTPWTSFPHGLPEAADFSYSAHAPSAPMSTWPANSLGLSRIDTHTRLDDAWKAYPSATRSMSYGEDQSGQFSSSSTRQYDRAHPPLATNAPESSLGAQGSLSAGAVPHTAYSTWPQPYQYAKPAEDYGGWYGDQAHHSPEAHISSTAADPSQAGGMYYSGR